MRSDALPTLAQVIAHLRNSGACEDKDGRKADALESLLLECAADLERRQKLRRPTFHDRYAIPPERRSKSRESVALLDCLLVVAPRDDAEFCDDPEPGEFAVVDLKTKEKGWFDKPCGATPDTITGMIEATMGAAALRVGPSLWIV